MALSRVAHWHQMQCNRGPFHSLEPGAEKTRRCRMTVLLWEPSNSACTEERDAMQTRPLQSILPKLKMRVLCKCTSCIVQVERLLTVFEYSEHLWNDDVILTKKGCMVFLTFCYPVMPSCW